MSQATKGREVVRAVFGGALYQQGRGFYSALEFFAILRGATLLEKHEAEQGDHRVRVLPPREEPASYFRPSHDHARRLLATGEEVAYGVFRDEATRRAVHSLLRGIEAPVPGRRSEPDKMQLRHFFPYPPEAIHYDTVVRRGKLSVERYIFRGAGGLAHRALRTDPIATRLDATREGMRNLLSDSDSAVGRLLSALSDHDDRKALPGPDGEVQPFEDEVEWKSLREPDGDTDLVPTQWVELIREGVHRILTRDGPSDFERVDALVHWIPFCTAMHQLAMARRWLGEEELGPLVLDAGREASPVRDRARRHLNDSMGLLKKALFVAAADMGCSELTRGSSAWWKGSRAFFTGTLHAVGAINAAAGRRHFVLRPQLLQAVVHAMIDEPVSFEVFSRSVLGERLGLVADPKSAEQLGIDDLSGRSLQNNATQLLARLDEVGLLRTFSDSTMMVGVHA
ncbi:MAG: hypothetical protein P1V81_15870 [Planctomycetota bacterium]|nr:hypothetical protein [Planctomycetota bacterium]